MLWLTLVILVLWRDKQKDTRVQGLFRLHNLPSNHIYIYLYAYILYVKMRLWTCQAKKDVIQNSFTL